MYLLAPDAKISLDECNIETGMLRGIKARAQGKYRHDHCDGGETEATAVEPVAATD